VRAQARERHGRDSARAPAQVAILARLRHPAIVAVHELDRPTARRSTRWSTCPAFRRSRATGADPTAPLVASQIALGLEALRAGIHGDLNHRTCSSCRIGAGRLRWRCACSTSPRGSAVDERQAIAAPRDSRPEVIAATPSLGERSLRLDALLYALIAKRPPYEIEGLETLLREQQPARATAPLADAGASPAPRRPCCGCSLDPRERPRDAGTLRRELEAIEPPLGAHRFGVSSSPSEREPHASKAGSRAEEDTRDRARRWRGLASRRCSAGGFARRRWARGRVPPPCSSFLSPRRRGALPGAAVAAGADPTHCPIRLSRPNARLGRSPP
jgi:hypothetical protein